MSEPLRGGVRGVQPPFVLEPLRVLKTALDLREDMKVDEALLYESISLLIVFIFFTWRWPEVQAIAV